jgi:hypothetical protein
MKEAKGLSFRRGVLWLGLFAVVGLLVFRAVLAPGALLFSSDDNVGLLSMNKRMVEVSAVHPWVGDMLAGLAQMSSIRPAFLLLREIPVGLFTNLWHGLCLGLGAWLVALWLGGKGLKAAACVFGALVAFWTGTNLTLTYAGHIGKYGVLLFCALALWATGKWGRSGKPAWGAVAGAAAGAMFLEQGDVALFCAVLLLPVGLLEAWRAVRVASGMRTGGGARPPSAIRPLRAWVQQLVPAGLAAVLLAGGAAWATRGSGVTDGVEAQSPEEHWNFITQWSQPPDESMDFIAPGWTGWRSGDPDGPYWGRMGRDAGWERTGRGFMNFKLETVYVGALPLFFALVAIADAMRRRRKEALLWTGLTVAALVLAFGKFTPLYRLVAAVPGFSDIRNPNKFIHFFQLGWGVLAALGLDAAMRVEARSLRRWAWAAWGMAAAVALAAGNAWAASASEAARLASAGWGPMGAVIQHNKVFALVWCAVSFAVAGAIVRLRAAESFPMIGKKVSNGWKFFAAWLAGAWVLAEAAFVIGPHYIQSMPGSYVAPNALTEHLKESGAGVRIAMATQDAPYYNQWLTYLFPHEGIPSLNVTQLPRPPADYAAYWRAVRDPVRQWQLAAVSHILMHGEIAAQILASPDLGWKMRLDWAYRPEPDGTGGWGVAPVPVEEAKENPAAVPEAVLAFRHPVARVHPVAYWVESEDEEALKLLAAPDFVPGGTVLLAPGSAEAAGLEPPDPASVPLPRGKAKAKVRDVTAKSGLYRFTVDVSETPVVARVAENWNAGWRAWIDGKAAPVLRADYLFQAVALTEPGTHEVELRYAPASGPVRMQAAGLLIGFGAAAWLAVGALRRKDD